MNLNSIFEELAGTPSKNGKLAILTRHKDNSLLKAVCRLALDPTVTFYIKKIPVYDSPTEPALFLESALYMLGNLSSRAVTGQLAINYLRDILSNVSPDDAKVIERIILKDLRCGVDTAVNKVWPNLVMDWPCMLATPFSAKVVEKFKYPALAQCKLDGMRFNAVVQDGEVSFVSRQGRPIVIADPEFYDGFLVLANGENVVYDGEILCRNEDRTLMDRKTGNGIINKGAKGTQTLAEGESVCAVLWDRIPLVDFWKRVCVVPYTYRFAALKDDIARDYSHRVCNVFTEEVNSLEEAQAVFERLLGEGQEGIILKNPKMPWKDARPKDQVKFKAELDCDLEIIDWVEGEGKYVGMMGKLVCASSDRRVIVGVGTGWSDEDRATIGRGVIGKIIAVRYNARVQDKDRPEYDSLFLPRVIEIRSDKKTADSSETIK